MIDVVFVVVGDCIDGFVNVVGINDDFFFVGEIFDVVWDWVIVINFIVLFKFMCVVIFVMEKVGCGVIFNVLSEVGLCGNVLGNVYMVSKYGIIGVIKFVVFMYGLKGICVNFVVFGGVVIGIFMFLNMFEYGFGCFVLF